MLNQQTIKIVDYADFCINNTTCIVYSLHIHALNNMYDVYTQVVGKWGEHLMKFGEEFLFHDDIGLNLGGIDSEGCNRVAGSKFSVLRGPLARLERALGQWFLDIHTKVVVYYPSRSVCM